MSGVDEKLASAPGHVPADRVFDFDLHLDPRLLADPHAGFASLHGEAPDIFWTPRNGGHWVMTRHDDVTAAMFDAELFSSACTAIPPPPADLQLKFPPLEMDGSEHRKHRLLVNKFLNPSAIKPLEPTARAMAVELIDEIAAAGDTTDYLETYSSRLPVGLWMSLMNMDLTRRKEFVGWVHVMTGHFAADDRADVMEKVSEYLRGLVAERERAPGDDPISFLLGSEVDGVPLTRGMVLDICNLLMTAGLDTVTNELNFIMKHLAENVEAQRRLRADPSLIPQAVEEMMRRFPIVNTGRVVTRDAEFRGVPLRKGEHVLACLPATGLDERRWECPAATDLDRKPRGHLGFNTGPHNCAGVHLARMELRVSLEEWLARIPEFRLKPGYVPGFRQGQVLGMESLDLVWS